MTLYSPIKDAGYGAAQLSLANDSSAYNFGLYFKVTSNCNINGIWWFCSGSAPGQYTNSLGDEYIALWTSIGAGSSSYVAGSVTAAGTYTQNAWNLIPFNSPIALTAGQEYLAVKGISSVDGTYNYSSAGGFFSNNSPGPGTNGFSEGPVLIYSSAQPNYSGLTNNEPHGNGQQGFYVGGTSSIPPDVTAHAPNGTDPTGTFHGGWYGMDVQISTTQAPSGSGLLMASFP